MDNWPPGLPLIESPETLLELLEGDRVEAVYVDWPADIEPHRLGFPTYFFANTAGDIASPIIAGGDMLLVTLENAETTIQAPNGDEPRLWILNAGADRDDLQVLCGYLARPELPHQVLVPEADAPIEIRPELDRYAGVVLGIYRRPGSPLRAA